MKNYKMYFYCEYELGARNQKCWQYFPVISKS